MIACSGLSDADAPARAAIEAARAAAAGVAADQRALAIVFAAGTAAAEPALVSAAVAEVTGAPALIGCAGVGVLTEAGLLEDRGVAVLLVGSTPVRCARGVGLQASPGLATSAALRDLDIEDRGAVLALFDAMAAPGPMLAAIERQRPLRTPILGGGAVDAGGHPWVIAAPGELPMADSLAAAWLPEAACRWGLAPAGLPLTAPLRIERAWGGVVLELEGQRAFAVLAGAVKGPLMADIERLGRSVFVGIERPDGPPLIRPLLGIDPYAGAIAVGGAPLQVGQRISFLLRDADQARQALHRVLLDLQGAPAPAFGLLIKSAGRGRELYGDLSGVETAMFSAAFPDTPFAGFLSACELAPTPSGAHVHLLSALVGLFS